jgi:hypothetical protein
MANPARELDDVSAQLAEVLRHADALLADWARFGAEVRARVEREAATIGTAVAAGVDAASERALAQRLAAVSIELERCEGRLRAAARVAHDRGATDRRLLAGIAIGVGIVIALLVVLVLRTPEPPTILQAPEPIRAVAPPIDAAPPPPPIDNSALPSGSAASPGHARLGDARLPDAASVKRK